MDQIRAELLQALKNVLEPLPYVHAMWEGGAAAFGRVDEWSDIDLMVDIDDGRDNEAFDIAEKAIQSVAPIELKYPVPGPSPWPWITQRFYRLRGVSPFLLIDLCMVNHSGTDKLLDPEMHGLARVHFDKDGCTQPPLPDPQARAQRREARRVALKLTFEMFQVLVEKELNRGNAIEAVAFYQSYTLRPLVEALRIRYAPQRSSFHTRYIHYDLPPEVVQRLEALFFVQDVADLRHKHQEAQQWFWELTAGE
jgi:hypothetical protein